MPDDYSERCRLRREKAKRDAFPKSRTDSVLGMPLTVESTDEPATTNETDVPPKGTPYSDVAEPAIESEGEDE